MSSDPARLVTELRIPFLPPPVAHYADATVLGDLIFVSGLLALRGDGAVIGPGDAGAQAEHIFTTLERILASAGSGLGDVAKLTIYLTDLGDRAAVDAARVRAFGVYRPASTLVEVTGLIGQGTLVEIEAVAGLRHIKSRA